MVAIAQDILPWHETAQQLTKHGLRVIPIHAGDKRPLPTEWQRAATTNNDILAQWARQWPDAGWGVVLGRGSNVIDIEADDAAAERTYLELWGGNPPITPTYRATTGRGKHRLFRWTDQLPNPTKSGFKLGALEFRVGGGDKGAQSVFPPSAHPKGGRYEWLPGLSLDDVEIAELPHEVISRIWALDAAGVETSSAGHNQYDPSHWTDQQKALWALENLSPARCHEYQGGGWLNVGMILHAVRLSCDDWDRWSQRDPAKYEPGACAEKWAGFKENGGLRINSLIHWAKLDSGKPTPWSFQGRIDAAIRNGETPTIVVSTEELRVNNQAVAALAAAGLEIYQRAFSLVRIQRDAKQSGGAAKIAAIGLATLREQLALAAHFVKPCGDNEVKPTHPPDWTVKAVHARGEWRGIRPLAGIITCPALRRDGTIVCTPGYDPETALYLDCERLQLTIPERPTQDDTKNAVTALAEVFSDFPFEKPHHFAGALAFLLTPLAREAFSGPAPLFLIDGNTPGVGKGLLTDVVSLIVTGQEQLPRLAAPKDDAECEKRITSLAMTGATLTLIDNVSGALGYDSLDAALTATSWRGRPLGKSDIVDMPLCITWAATGNNVQLAGDTVRRVCHVRLRSPLENPETRTGFRYANLKEHIRQNRAALVSAALTILRAYVIAGRPKANLTPWGSFEGWSDLVRQALVFAGTEDPGASRTELRRRCDTKAGAVEALFSAWSDIDRENRGVTTSQLLARLDRSEAVREAVYALCESDRDQPPTAKKLGRALSGLAQRVVDGKALDWTEDSHSKVKVWRMVCASTCG